MASVSSKPTKSNHAVAAKNGKLTDPAVIRGLLNQQWSMITGTAS